MMACVGLSQAATVTWDKTGVTGVNASFSADTDTMWDTTVLCISGAADGTGVNTKGAQTADGFHMFETRVSPYHRSYINSSGDATDDALIFAIDTGSFIATEILSAISVYSFDAT